MRLVSYCLPAEADAAVRLGLLHIPGTERGGEDTGSTALVLDLCALARQHCAVELPPTLQACITDSATALPRLRAVADWLERCVSPPLDTACPLGSVRLALPCTPPRNVLCIGANYREHAAELRAALAVEHSGTCPPVFTKPVTALTPASAELVLDASVSREWDYEVELAVVIGVGGANIPEERALEHIFGYSILNDVTARDLQRQSSQWYLGKGVDASSPFGPCVVPAFALPDPQACPISCRVNGAMRQSAHTGHMLFSVARLVHVLSSLGAALLPGDIIATGTPGGIGMSLNPPCYLRDGDTLDLHIGGMGHQRTTVRLRPGGYSLAGANAL